MHRLVLGTYRTCSLIQGGYQLVLALAVFAIIAALPVQGSVPITLTFAIIGLLTGLFLLVPRVQPPLIRAPQGFLHGLGAMFFCNTFAVIGIFTGYVAVISLGLEEPLSRDLAMLTALPTSLMTGLMWLAALLLIFVPPTEPPAEGPSEPTAPQHDLNDLRTSRMA
ncbi:hypothetical protein AB2B41_00995 [Marimonas sp. MJW-29]|uniref:Transmembrane protein n=1 Tax=Sulfitobacter sediminis TaxID=3234186 RepID=A0ABV3RGY3_9RHOB